MKDHKCNEKNEKSKGIMYTTPGIEGIQDYRF